MSATRKPRAPRCRFADFGWCADATGPLVADPRDDSSQAAVMARYRGRGPTTYSHPECGQRFEAREAELRARDLAELQAALDAARAELAAGR